ncbi:MAG: ABC transporter substrate-binding protein, partial [Syntrophus sp. (in: bacteria)]|nr:ABC transporter substrate-binding protein [Syntrophus sp. (in: bacteria)]
MTSGTLRTFLLLIGLFLLLLIAGCSGSDKPASPGKVKIGVIFPISGDLADKGKDSVNGIILAAEEINAAGGIAALDGAKLELIFGDTRGNPDIGVKETERLIKDQGVVAIIGTYQSSVTKPSTQVAERLETPFIVSISI